MEINVRMDVAEFQEFMEYRKAKGKYEAEIKRVKNGPALIATSLMYAVKQASGNTRKWKIVSQEHMDDAMDMAAELMNK